MNQKIDGAYGFWGTVVLWVLLYGVFLLFIPFYRPAQRKPAGFFIAFASAYALEMFGVPFSLYLVMWITGKLLPAGVSWGHTLPAYVGMAGHFLSVACTLIGGALIVAGWARVYEHQWKQPAAQDAGVIRTGIYRYMRHPQYTGFILVSLAALFDWVSIPLVILWPVLVRQYVKLALREEEALSRRFPDEWREYAVRTGRFLPRIRSKRAG